MDGDVIQSMARWPDVPSVFGWLALDRYCRWHLRGERVTHPLSIAFFERNYENDDLGRWFVQNGPQRVFVDLEYMPLVFSLDAREVLRDQRGLCAEPLQEVVLDNEGSLLLAGGQGPGFLDRAGLFSFCHRLRDREGQKIDEALLTDEETEIFLHTRNDRLPVLKIDSVRLAGHFGFQPKPKP